MLTLLIASLITTAQAKDIALTFDDCPRRTGKIMTGMERAHKITEHLKNSNVKQVAFFCNSPSRAKDGKQRLMHFANAGHVIANHSATHPSLHKLSAQEYIANIERGAKELESFPNYRKWFRYPFLHEGNSLAKRDAVRAHLTAKGVKNAYVTIDNADYYMDDLLQQQFAAGKKFDPARLCPAYADLMLDQVVFHDDLSVKALGRSVKHVLLMHETDLNALCLSSLVSVLRGRGWNIISADEAFADPISAREPSTLFLGQGRVAALAFEKGFPRGSLFSKWIEEKDLRREFVGRAWE